MTKWKKPDLLVLHNNLATRKGVPHIFDGTVMEICDAIERVNAMPDRRWPAPITEPKRTESLWQRFNRIINTPITEIRLTR